MKFAASFEEFAAKRRTAQERIEEALRPIVAAAADVGVDTSGWEQLLVEVHSQYRIAYEAETDEPFTEPEKGWREVLLETLRKTTPPRDEATTERITVWLATWILSQATIQSSLTDPEDLFLEWVDMADSAVRPAHRRTAGQIRPAGEPFDVDGVKMPYPGWPGAPLELWMNCRCTLRPVLATEFSGGWGAPSETEYRDVSPEERRRDADAGRALPDGSFPIDNCSDLKNAIQAIGRAKDPAKAKAHIRKRKAALGCPEVDLPESWTLESIAQGDTFQASGTVKMATTPEERQANTVFVAIPSADSEVHEIGDEPKHVTLAFLGETDLDSETLTAVAAGVAGSVEPFTADVSGPAVLGPDKAKVLLLEAVQFAVLRDRLLDNDAVSEAVAQVDTHPHFVPHLTLTYDDAPEAGVEEIVFDRLAVWHGSDQFEYALGGAEMPETETPEPVAAATQVGTAEEYLRVDDETGEEIARVDTEEEDLPPQVPAIPWHGVLAVEGKKSGDNRGFRANALRSRPLPLPLSWQKVATPGHDGATVTARIDHEMRVPAGEGVYEIRAHGVVRNTAEADEMVGLLADFGRFGVSVDADEAVMELDEDADDEVVWFADAQSCGACVVGIPAFYGAWVSLGEPPEDFYADGTELVYAGDPVEDSEALVAAAFVDVAPGRTEDGPGWLTHPVDTDRLRDYWVRGPGAAKIAWGSPGDFDRCRLNVAEYVKPQHINGYCANRHYDALGFWPGRGAHAGKTLEHTEPAEPVALVAAASHQFDAKFFADPEFGSDSESDPRLVRQKDGNYGCPLRITDDGQVFGHVALWGTCHVGMEGVCTVPPHSASGYAHFLLGEVLTTDGPVPVGTLSIGGGHAPHRMGGRAAMEHYDRTSTAFAYVNCGEDEHGIWIAGALVPGVPESVVIAARAAKLSGDWRGPEGREEMIAALAVNVPGFPIQRVAAGIVDGQQVSLVAAGMVESEPEPHPFDTVAFVEAIAAAVEERMARRERMAKIAARVNPNRKAMEAIAARVNGVL